ncbi:MAG: glycosyltransferase family 39 protein, partial [Candidatus Solibacter usitatus]|nr:glycosyltransferase family 39 protein [Candidatus Solibacter usitatus]
MAKKDRQRKDQARPAPPVERWPARVLEFLDRYAAAIAVALVVVGSLRIVSTYTVFNHTIDEPAHLACGMEWLDKKVYRYEEQHPPLARVAAALGPYLDGAHTQGRPWLYNEGAAILYYRNRYDRTLSLARLGILPFFWLASTVVFLWTRRCFGKPAGVAALLLFTSLPPVLAHAGLATTDMALAATLGAAFLALLEWLDRPGVMRTLWLGAALGLMALSKFSSLAFFPAALLVLAACRLKQRRPALSEIRGYALPALGALVLALALLWAGYRFSFGKTPFSDLSLPAPEIYRGIQTVIDHNRGGHPGYLLGEYSEHGWWVYYLVALAVKTPLPFLALLGVGLFFKRDIGLIAFVAGILLVAVFSRINIGIRHVLPVYIALAAIAGAGAIDLVRRGGWPARAGAALLLVLAATSALSHPDYLAYFNALAGSEPEKILVDSDLDWGQDMKRLGQRLREVGAREVYFNPFIVAHLEAVHGFPPIK